MSKNRANTKIIDRSDATLVLWLSVGCYGDSTEESFGSVRGELASVTGRSKKDITIFLNQVAFARIG